MAPIEGIAIAARLGQYAGAMLLLGAPLFFLRNLQEARDVTLGWTRALLWTGAGLVLVNGLVSAAAQTALMFGETAAAFRPAEIALVLTDTTVGRGLAVRLALTVAVAAVLLSRTSSATRWRTVAVLAAGIAASFAWTGHGAATEGTVGLVHLVADIVHLLAAALWLGALVPLLILVQRARRGGAAAADAQLAHDALHGFSGVGTLAVALLVATGLANTGILVGPSNLAKLPGDLYGKLLLAKLALFALMLGLAAANRFRLTPALARGLAGDSAASLRILRASVVLETLAACLVLALVAWLGTLTPPDAA